MTLTDTIAAHKSYVADYLDGEYEFTTHCVCGWESKPYPGTVPGTVPHRDWANHLQDAILAAYPALADLLPEDDCTDCGEWKQKDRMFPTLEGDLICGECAEGAE